MACSINFAGKSYSEAGAAKYLTPDIVANIVNTPMEDADTVRSLLKQWLPNLDLDNHLEFLQNIAANQNYRKQDILGEIRDAAIKLYGTSEGKYSTEAAYHEALHLILAFGVDNKWRNRLEKYARQKWGDKPWSELEHNLARELEQFDRIGQPKNIVERFFAKVLAFLRFLMDPSYTRLHQFYDLIRAGYFRENISSIPSDYAAQFSFMEKYLEGVSYKQFKNLLSTIRSYYYILSRVSADNGIIYSRSEIETLIYTELTNIRSDLYLGAKAGKYSESEVRPIIDILDKILTTAKHIPGGRVTVLNMLMKEMFPSFKREGYIPLIGEEVIDEVVEFEEHLYGEATEGLKNETAQREYEDLSSKLTYSVKSLLNSIPITPIPKDILYSKDALQKWNTLSEIEFVNASWAYVHLMDTFTNKVDISQPDSVVAEQLYNLSNSAPDAKSSAVLRVVADEFRRASDISRFSRIEKVEKDGNIVFRRAPISDRLMFAITPKTKLVSASRGEVQFSMPVREIRPLRSIDVSIDMLGSAVRSLAPIGSPKLKSLLASAELASKAMADAIAYGASDEASLYAYLSVFDTQSQNEILAHLAENGANIEAINRIRNNLSVLPSYRNSSAHTGTTKSDARYQYIYEGMSKVDADTLLGYMAHIIRNASEKYSNNPKLFQNQLAERSMQMLLKAKEVSTDPRVVQLANRYLDVIQSITDSTSYSSDVYRTIDPLSDKLEVHVYYASSPTKEPMHNLGFYELEKLHKAGRLVRVTLPSMDLNYVLSNIVSSDLAKDRELISALYEYVRARQTITEFNNLFSSTVEKNYMVGRISYSSDSEGRFTANVRYYQAQGYGLNMQVSSIFKESLETKLRNRDPLLMETLSKISMLDSVKTSAEFVRQLMDALETPYLIHYSVDLNREIDLFSALKNLLEPVYNAYKASNLTDEVLDAILQDNQSRINEIGRILSKLNPSNRAATVISGERKQLYKYTIGSYGLELISDIVSGNTEAHPQLSDPVYQANPLLSGGRIKSDMRLHDSIFNAYSNRTTIFTRENKKSFFTRNYLLGFVSSVANSRAQKERIAYWQFTYQPSDAARIPTVKLDMVTLEDIGMYAKQYGKVMQDRTFASRLATFSPSKSGSLLDRQGWQDKSERALAIEILEDLLPRALDSFERNRDLIKGSTPSAVVLNATIDNLSNNESYAELMDFLKRKDLDAQQTVYVLFYINNYLNGFWLNQLLYGDLRFFSSSKNIVKRGAGINGPAIHPRVGEGYTKPTARYYVVKDILLQKAEDRGLEGKHSAVEAFLRSIFSARENADEIVKEVLQYYDSDKINAADAQGIMSSARFEDLAKGYGNAFRFGRVHKPIYFGPAQAKFTDENGNTTTRYYTAYVKYSTFAISEELKIKYPELKALDEWMITNGVDEIVFESAVKSGKPAGQLPTLEDIVSSRHTFDERYSIDVFNSRYGMQFNAHADPTKGNVVPSQIVSFLNLEEGSSVNDTLQVYNTYAEMLYKLGYKQLESIELEGIEKFLVRQVLRKDDQEHLRAMLSRGVSINVPFVTGKSVIQSSSAISRKLFSRLVLPGGKMVLQSAKTIFRNDLMWRRDASTGRVYADVIVPKALLTEEQLEALKKGESVFIGADGFAVRIPTSEIHSAVVFKVKDVYDAVDTNIMIVPDEITAIAGSDFDVDALFVYTRNYDPTGRPYGYVKRDGKYVMDTEAIERDMQSNYIETAQNVMIDKIISIITHPKNETRMFSPISKKIFTDPSYPGSSAQVLKSIGRPYESLDMDLSDIDNSYNAFRDVSSGAAVIGITASFLKTYTALAHASLSNDFPTIEAADKAPKIEYGGAVHNLSKIRRDTVDGKKISTVLDSMLNLALDNPSDQFLSKINVDNNTAVLFASMIAIGVPIDMATRIFATPLINTLIENYNVTKGLKELSKKYPNPTGVLSNEKLDAYLKGQLIKQQEEELLSDLVDFLSKVNSTYVSIFRPLTTIMSLNRKIPVKNEDFLRISRAVRSAFGPSAMEDLASAYDMIEASGLGPTLEWLDSNLEIRSFGQTRFFRSMPHIAVSLMTTAKMLKLYSEQLLMFNPDITKALRTNFGIRLSDNVHENNALLAQMYVKFLFSAIATEKNAPNYISQTYKGEKSYLKKGIEAYLHDIGNIVLAVQKQDLALANTKDIVREGGSYGVKDVNLFLSFLNIRKNRRGVMSIGTHSSGTLSAEDYFVIRNSFHDLRKYSYEIDQSGQVKVYYNPTPTEEMSNVQRALIDYVLLNTAVSSGLSSFGLLLPPDIVFSEIQSQYNKLIAPYITKQGVRPDFLATSIRQFILQIAVDETANIVDARRKFSDSIINSETPNLEHGLKVRWHSKYSGKVSTSQGVKYFDLLVKQPDNKVYNIPSNDYIVPNTSETVVEDTQQEEEVESYEEMEQLEQSRKVSSTTVPIVVRMYDTSYILTDKVDGLLLYQRIGSSRSTVMEPMTMSIYDMFSPSGYYSSDVKTLPVLDTESTTVRTRQEIDDLVGDNIYVVPVNSASRMGRKLVRIESKVGIQDGYNVYSVKPVSSPDIEIDLDTPAYAVSTSSGSSTTLENVKDRFKNLRMEDDGSRDIMGRVQSPYYVDSVTGARYVRLTHPTLSIVNRMRSRPYQEEKKTTFAEDEAERLWEGLDPSVKLHIPSVSREAIDKNEFIRLVNARALHAAIRGTLAHLYIQKNIEKDVNKRAEIEREISKVITTSGVHANTMKWVDYNWKIILQRHNIDYENGKLASEITIASDIWGTATTVDLLVENLDGTFTIADFKFGKYFAHRMSNRIWKFGRQGRRVLFQTPKEQAKLEVMLRALILKTEFPDMKFKDLIVPWLPGVDNLDYTDYDKHVDVESHLAMIEAFLKDEYEKSDNKDETIYGKLKKLPHFDKLFDPSEYRAGYSPANLKQSVITSKSPSQRVDFLLRELIKEVQFQYSPRYANTKAKRDSIERANKLLEEVLDAIPNLPDIKGFEQAVSTLHLLTTSGRDSTHPMIQLVSRLYDEGLMRSRAKWHELRSKFETKRDVLIKLYYERKGIKFTPGKLGLTRKYWTSINPVEFWEWAYIEETTPNGTVIRRHPTTEAEWKMQLEKYPYLSDGKGGVRKEYKDMMEFILDTYDSFFIDTADRTALANQVATYRMDMESTGNVREITNIELATSNAESGYHTKFEYRRGQWFPIVPITPDEFGHMGVRWMNPKYRKEMWRRWFTFYNESVFEREFNEDEMIPMRYLGNPELISSGNYSLNVEEQFFSFVKYHIHKEHMDPVYAIAKAIQYRIRFGQTGENTRAMENLDKWIELFLKKNINGLKQRWFNGGLISRPVGKQTLYGTDEEGNPDITKGGFFNSFNFVKFINWAMNSAVAPLMWLKPLQGTANAVFSYMYGLKEGLKTDLARGALGKKLGIDTDFLNFSQGDLILATKDFFDMQRDAMLGKIDQNKLYILIKKYGYMPEESQFWSNIRLDKRIHRGLVQDESIMYIFHSLPEEALAMILFAAQLRAMKIKEVKDEQGNVTNKKYAGKSFWEMYEVKELVDEKGNVYYDVVWKDGYVRGYENISKDPNNPEYREITGLTTQEVRKMMFTYQWMYGNYRQDERSVFEYYIVGRLLLQLKRYIPTMLRKMFSSKGNIDSWGSYYEAGKAEDGTPILKWKSRVVEGRWRTIAHLLFRYTFGVRPDKYNSNTMATKIKRLFNIEATEEYDWSNLSEGQKEFVIDLIATSIYVGTMLAGYFWLFGAGSGDTERERIIAKYYMRIMMNFSQEWNVKEPVRDMLVNGMPVAFKVWGSRLTGMAEMTWALFMWPIMGEEAAFTKDGALRGSNKFMNSLPIIRSWVEVANMIADDRYSLYDYAYRIVR